MCYGHKDRQAVSGRRNYEVGVKREERFRSVCRQKQESENISEKTLSDMDHAIENLKKGIVSSTIDLDDFEKGV